MCAARAALEAHWSCSVMETNPCVCEVMCVESIQQYCGLCPRPSSTSHMGSRPQTSGMWACNSHVSQRSGIKHTLTHTCKHKRFAMHVIWLWDFYAIFNQLQLKWKHFKGFGMELLWLQQRPWQCVCLSGWEAKTSDSHGFQTRIIIMLVIWQG